MLRHRVVLFLVFRNLRTVFHFLGGSDGKESVCNAGGSGSIPGLGRSPGEGNDYALHHSCLENSMDREACQENSIVREVHGVAKSQTHVGAEIL